MIGVLRDIFSGTFDWNAAWVGYAKMAFKGDIKTRLRTYKKLGSMSKVGVPLPKALDSMWNLASSNGENPKAPLAIVLDSWRTSVNNGETLGEALAEWVPSGERMLIDAAGAARLDVALENTTEVVESSKAMKSAITGGLSYPCFLLLGLFGIMYVFGIEVIPAFAKVKPMEEWTGMAATMGVVAGLVENWTIPIIGGLITVGFVIVMSLPRWTGPIRTWLDNRVPPYTFYKMFVGTGFLLSMSALIKAGVPVPEALRRLRPSATPWLLEKLDATLFHVNEGQTLGEALFLAGYDFPDTEIIADLRLYAQLGSFDERMEQLAKQWIVEGVVAVKAKAGALNMLMIMLVGICVGAMGMGMMEIQDQITKGL